MCNDLLSCKHTMLKVLKLVGDGMGRGGEEGKQRAHAASFRPSYIIVKMKSGKNLESCMFEFLQKDQRRDKMFNQSSTSFYFTFHI